MTQDNQLGTCKRAAVDHSGLHTKSAQCYYWKPARTDSVGATCPTCPTCGEELQRQSSGLTDDYAEFCPRGHVSYFRKPTDPSPNSDSVGGEGQARTMRLPKNSAYPNFNEVHKEDDWCAKAGCTVVCDSWPPAGDSRAKVGAQPGKCGVVIMGTAESGLLCDLAVGHDGRHSHTFPLQNLGAQPETEELAEYIGYKIQNMLTDKYTNERLIEPSVSAPDLKGFLRYNGEEYVTVEKARKYASSSNAALQKRFSELQEQCEDACGNNDVLRNNLKAAEAELVRLKEALRDAERLRDLYKDRAYPQAPKTVSTSQVIDWSEVEDGNGTP